MISLNQQPDFSDRLAEIQTKASLDMDKRLPEFSRHVEGAAKNMETHLRGIFKHKADELRTAIEHIHDLQKEQEDESKRLTDGYLESRFEASLAALHERMGLILRINGENTSDTSGDIQKNYATGLAAFGNTSAEALLARVGLPETVLEGAAANITEADFALLKTIDAGAQLSEDQIEDLGARILSTVNGKENPSTVFVLGALKPDQRYKVMEGMSQDSRFPSVILDSTQANYLSIAQAEDLLAKAPQTPETAAALLRLKDPQLLKAKEQVRNLQTQTKEHIEKRFYGHKNPMKDLLTIKGIGSAVLAAEGAMIFMANFLSQEGLNPMKWLGMDWMNPGLWLGAGMFTAGAIGPYKALDKAEKWLDKDKDKYAQEKQKDEIARFQESLLNRPQFSKFYFAHADKINAAWEAKTKKEGTRQVVLKAEELDIDFKNPTDEFKGIPVNDLLLCASDWAREFHAQAEGGISYHTPDAQRAFINRTRKSQGLGTYALAQAA
jgi:hypothetical protein